MSSVDIKSKMVDDIRSRLRDYDLRKKALETAFNNLDVFLSKETEMDVDPKPTILYQYKVESRKDIRLDVNTITEELGNVYELIESIMRNNKLYSTEMTLVQQNPSLKERVKSFVSRIPTETKYTSLQNPQTLNIDLLEEAKVLPKIWDDYIWDMRERFMIEASYWKNIEMQKSYIILERNHLFGIVRPRVLKLFMAGKSAAQDKTFRLETAILTRELTDDLKNQMFPQPASQPQNKPQS